MREIQVSALPTSSGHTEASSADNSSHTTEETALSDQNEDGMTLGDALTQAKDASLASVEELHNLAGGADIKVHLFYLLSINLFCSVDTVSEFFFCFLILYSFSSKGEVCFQPLIHV